MKMKRISAGLLALALSVSAFAATASADEKAPVYAESAKGQDFVWVDDSDTASAPKAVSATRDANGIDLKWEKPTGSIDGYLIKAVHPSGESSGMWYIIVDKAATTAHWNYYFDQTKNWNYYVVPYTTDVYGNKVFGTAAKFDVKDVNTVTAPGRVEFTGSSKTSSTIELDWSKLDCDGYSIDFKSQNAADWKTLGTLGGSETHVKISKLAANTTYYVRMRAYKNNGSEKLWGAYSEEKVITTDSATSTTTPTTSAPGNVTITKAVNSSDSIRIYWNAIACEGYQIYFNSTGGDQDWKFIANVSKSTTDYRFTDLEPEHTYWISICAFNRDSSNNPVYGSFTKRSEVTAKKGSSVETVTAPAKVSINTSKSEVGYDSVKINWGATKCDGYELYMNETGYTWKHVATVAGDVTSYTFKKLKPNHEYWFTVRAVNKLSSSEVVGGGFSDNYHTTTKNSAVTVQRPATPQFYSNYSRTANAVRLNWAPVNCDGYFIYRYDYNKKAWVRVSIIKGANTTTKRFSGLAANTTYVYKMRAFRYNGTGKVYSLYSGNKSVTTKKN